VALNGISAEMTDLIAGERRNDNGHDDYRWEPGDYLAFLYTVGFLFMVAGVMYLPVPKDNVQIVNTLITIMSTIQIGIGKCYYDRSKADSAVQRSAAVQQAKASFALQEIARSAPASTAAAVAATVAASTAAATPGTVIPLVPVEPPAAEPPKGTQ
jgi:hypothetical protein